MKNSRSHYTCLFISHLSSGGKNQSPGPMSAMRHRDGFNSVPRRAPRARLFPLLPLPLYVLWCKSPEDQDSRPVCGVAHKERSVPIQANGFLFHLKSDAGRCGPADRVSRKYGICDGRSTQTRSAGHSRTERQTHRVPGCKETLTYLSGSGVLVPTPEEPLASSDPSHPLFSPNWRVWMEALGSVPRWGAASPSSRKGPLPEDGVNRLSLKVTSSGSGSGGQRKLQSFFRAVNAKRKMH